MSISTEDSLNFYLLCWPPRRGMGLVCKWRFSFRLQFFPIYNINFYILLILLFFLYFCCISMTFTRGDFYFIELIFYNFFLFIYLILIFIFYTFVFTHDIYPHPRPTPRISTHCPRPTTFCYCNTWFAESASSNIVLYSLFIWLNGSITLIRAETERCDIVRFSKETTKSLASGTGS